MHKNTSCLHFWHIG